MIKTLPDVRLDSQKSFKKTINGAIIISGLSSVKDINFFSNINNLILFRLHRKFPENSHVFEGFREIVDDQN